MRALFVALLVVALALSGCAAKNKDDTPDSTASSTTSSTTTSSSGTSTSQSSTTTSSTTTSTAPTAQPNRAPLATLASNVTSGAAPLTVNFTVGGTDADGDDLTFALSFGDGSTDQTSSVATSFLHTFSVAGNYTVRLVVSDGELESNATIGIAALGGSAGGLPPPATFSGTVQGVCGDAGFILTLMEGDCFPGIIEHTFSMPAAVTKIVVLLEWDFPVPTAAVDLDLYINNEGGSEVGRSACANVDPVPDPEIPGFGTFFGCVRGPSEEATIIAIDNGAPVVWTALIYPYQAPPSDYTLTVTYS